MARGVSLLRADPEHFILNPRSTYEYARVREKERGSMESDKDGFAKEEGGRNLIYVLLDRPYVAHEVEYPPLAPGGRGFAKFHIQPLFARFPDPLASFLF